MLDVNSLERRWLKYKIKRYLPYLIGIFLLSTTTLAVLIWRSNDAAMPSISPKKATSLPSSASTERTGAASTQQTMVLEPSMTFIQSMDTLQKEESPITQTASVKPASVSLAKPPLLSEPLPTNKVLQLPESEEIPPKPVEPAAKTVSDPKAISININRNETKVDIAELQKRFKETSNPNLGLFIARDAYNRGDYTEAYNYALKTNGINSHLDESWLIFAKSLVKLGKKDQAKKTLQLYISNSNSESARSLLDSIERGNFK